MRCAAGCTHRQHACRVFAGQFGRGGRFPATRHSDNHGGLLTELCIAWRGHAQGVRLLITSREPHLAEAHAAEVAAASPGAEHLGDGVYRGQAAPPRKLARMASLRCELDVLAAAPTPSVLVDEVKSLQWTADLRAHNATWELHCERRHVGGASHIPSPQLRDLLSQACGRQLRIARGSSTADVIRFAAVETAAGCFFGAVTYAPGSAAAADAAWMGKPHNYAAGMTLPLARLGTNLATGLEYEGACIVDPCCGSGTILFAAQCQGAAGAGGVELQAAVASQCRDNLAALRNHAHAERSRVMEEATGIAASEVPEVAVLTGDALHARFSRSVAGLVTLEGGADALPAPVDCIVSNLPFGRWVGVGGRQAHAPLRDTHADALPRLLRWLRPQAARHAYFSGEPLGELLVSLRYTGVVELEVDRHGKRFLTVASGE